jgi:copper chaperone NosL
VIARDGTSPAAPGRGLHKMVLFVACALALLVACDDASAPAEPIWGKQPCSHCAMVLSDKHFGAQLVTPDGERLFFDDVGCMVLYADEHKLGGARAWVRDATSAKWIDARAARYAAGAPSPMDFGFEASAEQGVAWNDMQSAVLAKKRGLR